MVWHGVAWCGKTKRRAMSYTGVGPVDGWRMLVVTGAWTVSENRFDAEPSLQEETRAARGRTLELILSVVIISAFLGLAINLGSTLLIQKLSNTQVILLMVGSVVAAALALLALIPRISTSIREFHDELEILIPLLVSAKDVEVLQLDYYNEVVDILKPALARRPAEDREKIAAAFQKLAQGKGRGEVASFALELVQFLFAVHVVKDSRSMLSRDAIYRKLRSVAFAQPAIVLGEWSDLAAHAKHNHYMAYQTQEVPAKTVLPDRIDLTLPHISSQFRGELKAQSRWAPDTQYVTLLTAGSKRDTALRVMALTEYSEYGLPRVNAPHRGQIARCIMRNSRDQRIRALAREEEALAGQLKDKGQSSSATSTDANRQEVVAQYTEVYNRVYNGNQRPHLLRIFVRLDGSFRIRLLSSERRQRGHYAWGVALSTLLGQLDIEVFLATLKEVGQKVPRQIAN